MGKTRYVYAHGKRIKVETYTPTTPERRRKRKPFRASWAKLPAWWVEVLHKASGAARLLAMVILIEAFKREHVRGNIVLSSEVTGMPSTTRRRAARELVKLGLIAIEQVGNEAPIVTNINKSRGAAGGGRGAAGGGRGAAGGGVGAAGGG